MSGVNLAVFDVSSKLKSEFASGNKRLLKVVVKGETLELDKSSHSDWSGIKSLVSKNDPCFVLYRRGGKQDWVVVTWMPESTKVKERMKMSTAKDPMKKALGYENFGGEFHATELGDFGNAAPASAPTTMEEKPYSEHELRLIAAQKEEEAERKEREQAAGGDRKKAWRTSGYHAVMLRLTGEAEDAVESMAKGNGNNWLHMAITEDKTKIELRSATKVSGGKLPVDDEEPGYYVYRTAGGDYAFIYCCPPKSKPLMRMVYSTAKPSAMLAVDTAGVECKLRQEFSDPDDVTDKEIDRMIKQEEEDQRAAAAEAAQTSDNGSRGSRRANNGGSKRSWFSRSSSKKKSNKENYQGSAYQLPMGNNANKATTKKIVLPPRGAYM